MLVLLVLVFILIVIKSQTPAPITSNPSSDPTLEPTLEPTTNRPSLEPNICNLFDGSNKILLEQNKILSNFEILDPFVIAFDFIIYDNNQCTSNTTNITCNLIQFGNNNELFLPKLSVQNEMGKLMWNIILFNNISLNNGIEYNLIDTAENKDISVPINKKTTFEITFDGDNSSILIYFDDTRFYYNNENVSPRDIINSVSLDDIDFFNITGKYQPFYISNSDEIALNASITNLCISTSSSNPTLSPTLIPTVSPTNIPSAAPINTRNQTDIYQKIDCYTRFGAHLTKNIQCYDDGFFMISCGVQVRNSLNEDVSLGKETFNKGTFIQRTFVNDIKNSDGICYIDYNINDENIQKINDEGLEIRPSARCCNFRQAYNESFRCRYFESSENRIIGTNQVKSDNGAAENENQFTFISCNDEFPILLSCSSRVESTLSSSSSSLISNDIDDIQYYGSFFAPSTTPSSNEFNFNPNDNLYFELFAPTKGVPKLPTITTTIIPTSINSPTLKPTKSPTIQPTTNSDTVRLGIKKVSSPYTKCVSQYGDIKGDYKVIAVATCCSDNTNFNFTEPTEAPTISPTFPTKLNTEFIGTNGTNNPVSNDIDAIFSEGGIDIIIGITEWGIYQFSDSVQDDSARLGVIAYQGLIIGQFKINSINDSLVTTNSDFGNEFPPDKDLQFVQIEQCAQFQLDIDKNDFINGYDVYYTRFAIFGITFYSYLGKEFSCPTNKDFRDTSINRISNINQGLATNLSIYQMSNISQRNIFKENGTFKLSGYSGKRQTRFLKAGVQRSLMGSIRFTFIGTFDASLSTTNQPTISDDTSLSNTNQPTLNPIVLLPGQSPIGSYNLLCYTIWGKDTVSCNDTTTDSLVGCNGYSITGQIFNAYIINDLCIVNTINGANNATETEIAAIATCCEFYVTPDRDFSLFIYISIIGGVLLIAMITTMSLILYLRIGKLTFFNPADIDDDTIIDNAFQNIGDQVVSEKIEKFGINESDHTEMVNLHKERSQSVGLQDDNDIINNN